MKDTIVNGTGMSRSMKAPPNFLQLFPSYEAFGRALIDGDVNFDLGPLNPLGCEVVGTPLNKGTLLSDETAALYGLGASAVPNDVLKQKFARIASGEYTGTGALGSKDAPLRLEFGFPAAIVWIMAGSGNYLGTQSIDHPRRIESCDQYQIYVPTDSEWTGHIVFHWNYTSRLTTNYYRFDRTGMDRYCGTDQPRAGATQNESKTTYRWIAIG